MHWHLTQKPFFPKYTIEDILKMQMFLKDQHLHPTITAKEFLTLHSLVVMQMQEQEKQRKAAAQRNDLRKLR